MGGGRNGEGHEAGREQNAHANIPFAQEDNRRQASRNRGSDHTGGASRAKRHPEAMPGVTSGICP
jgi:hypothetical protein